MKPILSRVLLIDPDPTSIRPLTESFGKLGAALDPVEGDMALRVMAHTHYDLVLVHLDGDESTAIGRVRSLAAVKSLSSPWIVAVSSRRDVDSVLRAIRAGAHDVLQLPASADEVAVLVARLPRVSQPSTMMKGRLIAVTGASGGVGSTSIALNLAALFAEDRSKKVALVDLDLLFGSIALWLNLNPTQNLADVVTNVSRLDAPLLVRSMTRHAETNLSVLPCPDALEEAGSIDPESLGTVLDVLTETFDLTVIDTSKAYHVTDMIALERADLILMVVQCDLISLYQSARLLNLFRRLNGLDDRVRLVLNRSGSEGGAISIKKAEQTLGKPVLCAIPNAFRAFHQARTYGSPLDRRGPARRVRPAFEHLARLVREEQTSPVEMVAPTPSASPKPRLLPSLVPSAIPPRIATV